jgi:hypothetical protein
MQGVALKDSLPFSSVNVASGEFLALIGFVSRKKLVSTPLEAPPPTSVPADAKEAIENGASEKARANFPNGSILNTSPEDRVSFGHLEGESMRPHPVGKRPLPEKQRGGHGNDQAGPSSGAPFGNQSMPDFPSAYPALDVEVIEEELPVGGDATRRERPSGQRHEQLLQKATGREVTGSLGATADFGNWERNRQVGGQENGARDRLVSPPGIAPDPITIDSQSEGVSEGSVKGTGGLEGTVIGPRSAPPAELRAVQAQGGGGKEAQRKRLFDSINALSQGKLPEGGQKKLDERDLDWAETGASAPLDGQGTAKIAPQGLGSDLEEGFWEERARSGALASTPGEGVESMYSREQARVRGKRDRRRGPGEMPGSIVGGLLEASAAIKEGGLEEGGRVRRGRSEGARRGGVGEGQEEGLGKGEREGRGLRGRRARVEEWSDDDDDGAERKSDDERGVRGVGDLSRVRPAETRLTEGFAAASNDERGDKLGEAVLRSARDESLESGEALEDDPLVKKRVRRGKGRGAVKEKGDPALGKKKRLRKVGGEGLDGGSSQQAVRETSPGAGQSGAEGLGPTPEGTKDGINGILKSPSRAGKRRKLGVTFQDGAVVLDIKTGAGDDAAAGISIGDDVAPRQRRRRGPVVDLSDEDQGGGSPGESAREPKRGPQRKKPQAFDLLALPGVLARLERVFNALNVVYSFLQRQHVQPTWQNVKGAVRSTLGDETPAVTSADVESLQALCPQVVLLRNFVGFRREPELTPGQGFRGDAPNGANCRESEDERLTLEEGSKAEMSPPAANGVKSSGLEGRRQVKEEREDDEPWLEGLRATGEGDKAEDLDGDYSFTIDIVDPSRGPGSLQRVPVIDLEGTFPVPLVFPMGRSACGFALDQNTFLF